VSIFHTPKYGTYVLLPIESGAAAAAEGAGRR
jgi:hypothetical protein